MQNKCQDDTIKNLIKEIPKTEIHLHLEALASTSTVWKLFKKHRISIEGIHSKTDLVNRFRISSLDEFVWVYINILQNAFRENSDIGYLIDDARDYLKTNNITYAEIFFAPSKFLQSGLDFNTMIDILQNGADVVAKKDNIEMFFIIDVSRSYGPGIAMENLEYTLNHPVKRVIGIGLGGAESNGPAKEYQDVFKKAIEKNLRVVAHAGEDVGPESIRDAVSFLQIARIGHGISAVQDEELMDLLAKLQIPLEVCPTSNIFTKKFVSTYKDHPIRIFFDKNLYVTVNTDDPVLFDINLVDEYMNLYTNGIFSIEEILHLIKNNVFATFMTDDQKKRHWEKASAVIEKHGYIAP